MKKVWKILSTVLVWAVVAVAVFMMVFTIISVNTFDRNDRSIFGFRFYIALSDSMSATDFDAGDLVLVKQTDPLKLEVGDIIAYQSQNTENYGETVTHKIRAKTMDENGNRVEDGEAMPAIRGVFKMVFDYLDALRAGKSAKDCFEATRISENDWMNLYYSGE